MGFFVGGHFYNPATMNPSRYISFFPLSNEANSESVYTNVTSAVPFENQYIFTDSVTFLVFGVLKAMSMKYSTF
jgi:hypothetical protein